MITEISAPNAEIALVEAFWKLRANYIPETTRNGPVYSFPFPVLMTIRYPRDRIILNPVRDANPFFHVMEFVWMMAGSWDIKWISQFNKNMMSFSDDGATQWAAYGHRWRNSFNMDQIYRVVDMLKRNPADRRVVMQMWDANRDLGHVGVDVPCNTQILFRVVAGQLDMTVINRSNDIVWGMLGANVVHMTMLQELITQAAGLYMGNYRVFSTNAHFYPEMPRGQEIWETVHLQNTGFPHLTGVPLLHMGETLEDFLLDAEAFIAEDSNRLLKTEWFKTVAMPMHDIWWARKNKIPYDLNKIGAADWRNACQLWIARRDSSQSFSETKSNDTTPVEASSPNPSDTTSAK